MPAFRLCGFRSAPRSSISRRPTVYRRSGRRGSRADRATRAGPRRENRTAHLTSPTSRMCVPFLAVTSNRREALACSFYVVSGSPARPMRSGFELRPRGVSPRPGNRDGGSACYMYRSTLRSLSHRPHQSLPVVIHRSSSSGSASLSTPASRLRIASAWQASS